jgi:hypothetical protein
VKLFIGWSGERSQAVAKAFYEWIRGVVNAAEPWMSEEDIAKGSNWTVQLGTCSVCRFDSASCNLLVC